MKKIMNLLMLVCFYSTISIVNSQNNSKASKDLNPIYDYGSRNLSSIDSVPDFNLKDQKLKLTGVIYQSDGKTPAKDVILYVEQPDEYGNFDLREDNGKRYVHHRVWVKTDNDGRYTIYTFVPGNDRRYQQYKQLFPVIKEPSKEAYEIETFLFDDDPLVSKYCRKRLAKKGDITRILKPKMVDGILVAERDIILKQELSDIK
jgi:protocatechuate 3,4-dioxygenase beta subunit